ncbi:uncharacterized protein BYT42DRAFT_578761 [Radiomyces spectabilis]|uniref:uncharacterized protein n=1 Tax=Radiomyces spectabilis TaxID=64574 RepID=UPI0022211466|nr:uncharacterized protein BYT42DRAFT_578761 [Radiomyces spectabilis]KAI8372976.1 hypothetical protein BYT42DRAFT_578761 [Radiomyces spectabilis]
MPPIRRAELDETSASPSVNRLEHVESYFRITAVALFSLYAIVYIVRFISWRRKRRRDQQDRHERQQLRLVWMKAMMDHHWPYQCCSPRITPISERSLCRQSHSYCSTLSQPCDNSMATLFSPPSSWYDEKQTIDSSTDSSQQSQLSRYWRNNKARRRRLIWQWSLAMGYCRYAHAQKLESLIAQHQLKSSTSPASPTDRDVERRTDGSAL